MSDTGQAEVHLFIIWELARREEKRILEDIGRNFEILAVYEVQWSKTKFAENLKRFYGAHLPRGSGKDRHIGRGPFLAVIVKDHKPGYKVHETTKGPDYVNSALFMAKSRHRQWTGGGHRTHATNTPAETNHDLAMLFGLNTKDFLKSLKARPPRVEKYANDLVGSDGWLDIAQLFYILNATIPYLVLRNYEPLPDSYYLAKHGDIDLLVENYETVQYKANAQPVFKQDFRVHNRIKIGGQKIMFDFRHVGDGYYDEDWQQQMLKSRQLKKRSFYVPSGEDYFFSLLYHALLHKPKIGPDYTAKLARLGQKLKFGNLEPAFFTSRDANSQLARFLAKNHFGVSTPQDKSVFWHEANAKQLKLSILKYQSPSRYWAVRLKNKLSSSGR